MDGVLSTCSACGETFFREHYMVGNRHVLYKRCPECRPTKKTEDRMDLVDLFSRPVGARLSGAF